MSFYMWQMGPALESRHKGSNTPSIRSPVVDRERMRPGHWLGISALCSIHCFDNDGWVTGRMYSQ